VQRIVHSGYGIAIDPASGDLYLREHRRTHSQGQSLHLPDVDRCRRRWNQEWPRWRPDDLLDHPPEPPAAAPQLQSMALVASPWISTAICTSWTRATLPFAWQTSL